RPSVDLPVLGAPNASTTVPSGIPPPVSLSRTRLPVLIRRTSTFGFNTAPFFAILSRRAARTSFLGVSFALDFGGMFLHLRHLPQEAGVARGLHVVIGAGHDLVTLLRVAIAVNHIELAGQLISLLDAMCISVAHRAEHGTEERGVSQHFCNRI